jgi:hypothetical protein
MKCGEARGAGSRPYWRRVPVKRKCDTIRIIEDKLARSLWSIVNPVGNALDATLPVFVEQRIWVLYQKSQAGKQAKVSHTGLLLW